MAKVSETESDLTFADIPASRAGRKAVPNPFLPAVTRLADMVAKRQAEGHNDSGKAVLHTFADADSLKVGLRQLAAAGRECNVTVSARVRDESDPFTIVYWARTRIAKPRKPTE